MVTPDPEKYDPEKHVTGSLGLVLGLANPNPNPLVCSESPFPGSWGH